MKGRDELGDELKEFGKRFLASSGAAPARCGVDGCEGKGAEVVELAPLDPIDHDSTFIQLCPTHQEWAAERNELARDVADALRERRREIGEEMSDEIARLATPQDGDLADDILHGHVDAVEAYDGEVTGR